MFAVPAGYTFLNMPRDSENRGGGIAMLYKTPLKMLLKPADDDFKFSTFEHACITNSSHSINFVIVCHHHPSAAEQATTRFLHAQRSSANAAICCSCIAPSLSPSNLCT